MQFFSFPVSHISSVPALLWLDPAHLSLRILLSFQQRQQTSLVKLLGSRRCSGLIYSRRVHMHFCCLVSWVSRKSLETHLDCVISNVPPMATHTWCVISVLKKKDTCAGSQITIPTLLATQQPSKEYKICSKHARVVDIWPVCECPHIHAYVLIP